MNKIETPHDWVMYFEQEERKKLTLDEETKQMALKWLRDHGEKIRECLTIRLKLYKSPNK